MKYITLFFKDVIQRPSLYFFVFVIIFSVDRHRRLEDMTGGDNGPFYSDVYEYYTFLPEYFYDYAQLPQFNPTTNKRTIGMAIMYAPAFFVGHCMAKFTGDLQNGYSPPYQWAVRWGSIIYCILGLAFCRKSLLLFFRDPIVVVTLACVFFGTNLLYYTFGAGEFPHGYLFFLNSVFIYFSLKWILQKNNYSLAILCLTGGMIMLIRPTGILVFLFPLLFGVHSLSDMKDRLKYTVKNPLIAGLSVVLFVFPLVFQSLIWKKYHGHYIYYSYTDERFFFNDPQVLNFLVSFRKGWLVYTPMMIFSLIGIFLSAKYLKQWFLFSIIYFVLNVYILSCWWDWAYGGSFGCRVLVESYAFLAFPFAAFVAWFWQLKKNKVLLRNVLRISLLAVFYLFIELNFFQMRQYKYGKIHWNGMNWETYKAVFLKDINKEQSDYLNTRFTPPDVEKMKRGERDE